MATISELLGRLAVMSSVAMDVAAEIESIQVSLKNLISQQVNPAQQAAPQVADDSDNDNGYNPYAHIQAVPRRLFGKIRADLNNSQINLTSRVYRWNQSYNWSIDFIIDGFERTATHVYHKAMIDLSDLEVQGVLDFLAAYLKRGLGTDAEALKGALQGNY